MKDKQIARGKFISFLCYQGWEYVQRIHCSGIVVMVAMNQKREVIFTEQYRIPVRHDVVEFPAGLVNDEPGRSRESLEAAAKRELMEETGYQASRMQKIAQGPLSSGLTSEVMTFFRASGLKKMGEGGGVGKERIIVHEIPLAKVESWLLKIQRSGRLVDPKIYAGLFFLKQRRII